MKTVKLEINACMLCPHYGDSSSYCVRLGNTVPRHSIPVNCPLPNYDCHDALLEALEKLALPCLESSHQLHLELKELGRPVAGLAEEEVAIKLLNKVIAEAEKK